MTVDRKDFLISHQTSGEIVPAMPHGEDGLVYYKHRTICDVPNDCRSVRK